MSYDLVLQRKEGGRDRAKSEQLIAELRLVPALGCCEVLSAFHGPDENDLDALSDLIEEDESDFEDWCSDRKVEPDSVVEDARLAAAFLDDTWGAALVTVSIPARALRAAVADAYAAVVEVARARGLQLHDPQVGEDVDLDEVGSVPAEWE